MTTTTRQSENEIRCTLCDSFAVATFFLDHGCIAFPDVQTQSLCPQHIVKATPRGGMVLLENLCLPGSDPLPGGWGAAG